MDFLWVVVALVSLSSFSTVPGAPRAALAPNAGSSQVPADGMRAIAMGAGVEAPARRLATVEPALAQAQRDRKEAEEDGPEMSDEGRLGRLRADACAAALDNAGTPPPGCGAREQDASEAMAPTAPVRSAAHSAAEQTPAYGSAFDTDSAAGFNIQPPDSSIAAGPSNLLVATNNGIRAYSKTGAPLNSRQNLNAFFNTSESTFDPRVVYDPYVGRFFVTAVSKNPATRTATLHIAISEGSDATGPWKVGFWDVFATEGYWCDYPALGFSQAAIYVSCNMFDWSAPANFQHSEVSLFSTAQLLSDPFTSIMRFAFHPPLENGRKPFTLQPAQMYGAATSNGEFLVDTQNALPGSAVNLWQVTGDTNPASASLYGPSPVSISPFDVAPRARQANVSGRVIDTGDARMLFATWRAGQLTAGFNRACNGGADACFALVKIGASGYPHFSRIADWTYNTSGEDYYYPSGQVNSAGQTAVGFSWSDGARYPGGAFISVPAGCLSGSCIDASISFAAGQNTYQAEGYAGPGNVRWGDYSGAALDPDGTGIWLQSISAAETPDNWTTSAVRAYESAAGPIGPADAATFMLQVEPSGSGSGSVTSNDGAIRCGAVCAGAYAAGSSAVLTARPSMGSALQAWIGCDAVSRETCTVTANQDRTVTAIFSAEADGPAEPGGRRRSAPY